MGNLTCRPSATQRRQWRNPFFNLTFSVISGVNLGFFRKRMCILCQNIAVPDWRNNQWTEASTIFQERKESSRKTARAHLRHSRRETACWPCKNPASAPETSLVGYTHICVYMYIYVRIHIYIHRIVYLCIHLCMYIHAHKPIRGMLYT